MSQFKTWLRWEDFPRLPMDTHSAVSQLPTTWPQLTAPGHAGTRPGEDHKAAAWVTGLGSSRQRRLSKMLSHSERGLSRYREMLVSWWLPPCEVVEWEDNLKVLSRLQRGLSASLKLLFPLVKRINTRQHLAFVCNENWYNHNFLFSQTTMRSTLFLLITLGSVADTWQLAEHSIVFVLVLFYLLYIKAALKSRRKQKDVHLYMIFFFFFFQIIFGDGSSNKILGKTCNHVRSFFVE